MFSVARLAVAAVVFLATYLFSFWMIFAQVFPAVLLWMAPLPALLLAGWVTRSVWMRLGSSATAGPLTTAIVCAAVVGAISFCAGFFGPMIFAPDGNQGPLLGILITGPLGFVAGGIFGLFYGLRRRAVEAPEQPPLL